MRSIYYVEDDGDIAESVRRYLEQKEFRVETMRTAAEARRRLKEELPVLLLVDWNLPDENGDSLCLWVRRYFPALPVIFLTVKGDSRDMVYAFDRGADDYLVKPFDLPVLHSRICALLRRSGTTDLLECGSISLDKGAVKSYVENPDTGKREEVMLSAMEYQLLTILLENKNRTVTRRQLLENLWDVNGNFVNDNTLTVTMKRLRERLGEAASLIKTVRSFGYRMEEL